MHVKRKKHKLPDDIKPRKTCTDSSQPSKPTTAILHSPTKLIKILPSPIIIRQVVKLPRQVTTSTQTSKTSSNSKDTACQTDLESNCNASISSQTQTVYDFVCDYAHSHSNTDVPLQSLQQSTMTISSQLHDSVTTQTEHSHCLSCITDDLFSLGTQTMDYTLTQGSQTQLTSSCEFGTQTTSYEIPSSMASSEVQCPQYDLNTLGLVDFGTQTTTHNPSRNQLDGCEVSDFGTQTIFLPSFHCMESALSCSVGHDELDLLPHECMDFGTQTGECELDSIPCFDFGVQTALDLLSTCSSGTKDQGSQT